MFEESEGEEEESNVGCDKLSEEKCPYLIPPLDFGCTISWFNP